MLLFKIAALVVVGITVSKAKTLTESTSATNTTLEEKESVSVTALKQQLSPYEIYFYSWFPWKRAKHYERIEYANSVQCEELSSINEFPSDLFTDEQRQQGAFVLHIIGAIYFFTICGLVINNYFLPSVECLCDDLKITPDVAAAVFMATATATPELCTNTISIFIADSDMGLGTVIGSLMWNVLGVAALASFATSKPVRMDWLPITRDSIIFAFNSLLFFFFVWDGKIYWWEALTMLLFIILYFFIMFQNNRITKFVLKRFHAESACCSRYSNPNYDIESEKEIKAYGVYDNQSNGSTTTIQKMEKSAKEIEAEQSTEKELDSKESNGSNNDSLWNLPRNKSVLRTIFWYYSWPIKFVLTLTIPNPVTWRKLYPITFIICVGWIGMLTYFIFWMMVVVAHTFGVPESVMGLTVFAIGGCTPEMITGFIMARRGSSGVGVAHSLGAASLAILISLGLPWFLRTIIDLSQGKDAFVSVHSDGMEYTVLSLVAVVASLYICLAFSGFRLTKTTGIALFVFYLIYITLAVLIEVDIFFPNKDC